jgi:imidazolonepropionase-like amidohydrolase/acetylornithine deacetylase/succinyl-diaminopimelate desuccinylase-like protein
VRSTGCKAAAALLALLASITAGAAEPPATPTASATLTPLQAKAREIFERVIAFKSIAPGYETPQLVDYLAGELRTAGFAEQDMLLGRLDETAYLVVRYRGQPPAGTTARKPILLLSHLDVVPALKEHWKRDPFKLEEANGFFYGRGTLDVKNGVATLVALFARLKQEGFVPTRDLVMVLTGDEETTGATARKLIDERRDWVDAEYALNTDAGGGTLDKDGKALSYNIQTAEKTYASYKLSAFNAGGHSSQPRADNAIYELADALKAVQAHRFPVEWSETTIGYFKAMGVTTAGPLGAAMRAFAADPRDAAAADELWKHPAYVGATRTTCVATQLRAGHAENALPQQATATVNCRIFPGVTPQAVRETLQQVVGEKIEVEVMDEPRYSDASPLRDDVLQAVTAAVHARHPGIPIIPIQESGATDGLFFRAGGIPTYGISEIFIRAEDQYAHGLDERIPVQSFYDGLDHWHHIVHTLAGSALPKITGGPLVVDCGKLVDGLTDSVRERQRVRIEAGRIVSVEPLPLSSSAIASSSDPAVGAPPPGARHLDLSAYTCLPGLLDLHTHITDLPENTADFRIYPRRSPDEHMAFARTNAAATLQAGFTTVRDVGGYVGGLDRELRDEIDAGRTPGPRMQVSIGYLTISGGGGDMLLPGFPRAEARTPLARLRRGVAKGPDEFAAKARAFLDEGADVLKIIASGAVLSPGGVPGSPEMTPAEIEAVAREAKARGKRLAAHAHGARSVKEAILAGADTIEHASIIDEEGLLLARERGVALAMDVYNGDYIDTEGRRQGWPAEFLQKNLDTTELQRKAFTRAVELGVPIVFASDAGVFPHGLNARQFRIMVERGMTPMQAIRAATGVAAHHMGWSDRVGALAPGRYGDLIAVRGDPLTDITMLERVDVVVKGGVVAKDGVPAPVVSAQRR